MIFASTPSSCASTSIDALSVSTCSSTSPAANLSPSLTCQRERPPDSIVGLIAGMRKACAASVGRDVCRAALVSARERVGGRTSAGQRAERGPRSLALTGHVGEWSASRWAPNFATRAPPLRHSQPANDSGSDDAHGVKSKKDDAHRERDSSIDDERGRMRGQAEHRASCSIESATSATPRAEARDQTVVVIAATRRHRRPSRLSPTNARRLSATKPSRRARHAG